MKKVLALLMALTLALNMAGGVVASETRDDRRGESAESELLPLHVDGSLLKDSDGNVVQLRGVSSHGLSWYPEYINKDLFKELHDKWGANVVRLAMYTEEYNGYCIGSKKNKSDLKALIKRGVSYAKANNLYVIIDWHILSDGNPNSHRKAAKSFFAWAAKTFKDYDNVLYEICNEPNGDVSFGKIKSYANYVIPSIRKYDEDAVIIVGTPTWSQELLKAAENPITEYENIMYSLHFYAGTHKRELQDTLKKALEKGLPVFVTEFGISEASGNGKISKSWGNKWIKLLDDNNISYVAWNLSNKDESSALIKSSVKKTRKIYRSNLTNYGKWYYDLLRERAGL